MTPHVRRLLWFAAAAAVACGARPPPPRDLPALTDLPGDGSAAPPVVAPVPAAGGLAALVAAVGPRPLVIEDVTSLRLNAVERRRAQQVIATWAAGAGFTILPPANVEDAVDRATEGVDPTTGQACGPALDRTAIAGGDPAARAQDRQPTCLGRRAAGASGGAGGDGSARR